MLLPNPFTLNSRHKLVTLTGMDLVDISKLNIVCEFTLVFCSYFLNGKKWNFVPIYRGVYNVQLLGF